VQKTLNVRRQLAIKDSCFLYPLDFRRINLEIIYSSIVTLIAIGRSRFRA
jgi:hypothetical protein